MSEENLARYLPYSARRYKVNQYGKILDSRDQIIETYESMGMVWVDLEWVFGKRAYSAALVVLVAFSKITLPEHLLDAVEPLLIDGTITNLAPVNLIYRFRQGPVPVENFPGFFYIPFYTDYGLREDGRLINVKTGKEKVWSITKSGGPKNQTGGYYYNRVVTDDGFSKTLFLHRALCLVFKTYGNNVLELVVNHLDGKPWNNSLANLEWATYLENNVHAIETGLRPNSATPVLMKDLRTGTVLRFESTTACARHLNNPRGDFIRYRLEHSPSTVFADMLLFKYDDDSVWPDIDLKKIEVCRQGLGSDILARNVFTGEQILFRGCNQGSHLTGVKAATILRHVREEAVVPVSGWNFRYRESACEWPVHSERHLQIYEKYPIYPGDGVVVVDVTTGEEKFFLSAADASNALALGKRLLWAKIASGEVFKDKYRAKFFKLKETLSLPAEKSAENKTLN